MPPGALLRFPGSPAPLYEHAALEALVVRRATHDGHNPTPLGQVCIYRFSQPTKFTKAPTFGVTLGVVLSGVKEVRLEGRNLRVDPSRHLVITRETEFEASTIEATPERPYLGLSLCFCPEAVARALVTLAEAGAPSADEVEPAFLTTPDPAILAALGRMLEAIDDPLDRQVLAPLAIEEVLFRLLRSDAAATLRSAVGRESRILAAMQFIRRESARPLSVDTIARHVAMSPSHFAHRFRAVARMSPMRFLREIRLEQARNLLGDPTARAGEIGQKVGFESPSHFNREFKRRYGAAPIEYAKSTGVRR